MATNFTFDGGSPFRIKRPRITTSGFVSDVDPIIKQQLDELDKLLGKRIFTVYPHPRDEALAMELSVKSKVTDPKSGGGSAKSTHTVTRVMPDVRAILDTALTPKRTPPGHEPWAPDSLAARFAEEEESPVKSTLSEYIDMTAELSALKYAFDGNLSANWFNLDYNTKAVLDSYPAIKDYLVAYGYYVQEVNGLKNFILSNRVGAKRIANYAIVSAARAIIDKKQLNVHGYNHDDSAFVIALKNAGLSLSAASFKSALQTRIDDFVLNSKESKIVDEAEKTIGPFPAGIKPLLIKYIKNSPVPITQHNANFYLPLFISQIEGVSEISDPTDVDTEEADKDFDVDFLEDDNSLIQVSKSAVKCAAQLYYGMILGDELDVFNVANFFTHKYLIRGGLEIQDSRLRDDLQMYVFSGRFTDQKTKKIVDRTRPPERQMFYRQVFNYGNGQITDDVIVNSEFSRLWKVLILESAKYLERAQASFNPDSYVSRQNVMQSVEDLQYNLSTHCTGMANVITPIIYAELNFVIQRIFMHPEILRQVVPQGGTWWRVVETLYMAMKNTRPRSTVIYNKAKLGHDIIRSIADYNPATFEDDQNFSAFISNVDAFITTQSILQESLSDDLRRGDAADADASQNGHQQNGYHSDMPDAPAMAATPGAGSGADEWDF
jgi:hypothetical protein